MRAGAFKAFYGGIAFLAVCAAGFLSGCASGHKQFVYVAGPGTNETFEFRIQSNGALVPLGTPNFPVGSNPVALKPHTSGDFLYIADFSGNDVTLLDINQSTGNPSVPVSISIVNPTNPPNIFATDKGPVSLAMSPTAPFLFAVNQTAGNVSVYTVDPGTGSLGVLSGSPFPIQPASHPSSVAISPTGNFLFVANATEGTIAVFSIGGNGALAQAGLPTSVGAGATPTSIAVEHSGRFLYVTDPAHNAVLGFSIQAGVLSPINGSPFLAGSAPSGLGIDPQGALLYVANSGSNNVSAYAIDSSTGALGQVTGSPFATGGVGPSAVAVDADTSFVYVTEAGSHDIAAFNIASNGALSPVKGSPFGVATAATAITVVRR
ncbi:MAG TPA: beta-propeller fold lactonase family protein [Candidatus Angelobacter sp.]|nr:beta-propeller fold lactonase family protein [Candidatus Angelobacter sp.]